MKSTAIAIHNTRNGWAIGILQVTNRHTGEPIFQVVRMDRRSVYVVIKTAATEKEARRLANREWSADMGHEVKHEMIACGPGAM
jgi:hypothetical protein